jgi:hypothetical protein
MRVVETRYRLIGEGRSQLIVTFEEEHEKFVEAFAPEIGGGPIQSRAIPDEIVHALITVGPPYSLTLSEIHKLIGGNPRTINRQAWTLATNAPDLQIRLRGWVYSPERGRYSLTPAAIRHIEGGSSNVVN